MYLISSGVNNHPHSPALSFAEKDASDIYQALTGGKGSFSQGQSKILLGSNSTVGNMYQSLRQAAIQQPDHFLFFFSGHGNKEGLGLSDGTFSFWDLHNFLRNINAKNTLVILDVCHAGSFLLKEGQIRIGAPISHTWMDVLANATPSTRLFFSCGSDRSSSENNEMLNGCFTGALLEGMKHASPTLESNRIVSDTAAFYYAKNHILYVQKRNQIPECKGLTGDFPLQLSEKTVWVGNAYISDVLFIDGSVKIQIALNRRKFVSTRVHVECVDRGSQVLFSGILDINPIYTQDISEIVLNASDLEFKNNYNSYFSLVSLGYASVYCFIKILDGNNDIICEDMCNFIYSNS